jgi:hypothetical protein
MKNKILKILIFLIILLSNFTFILNVKASTPVFIITSEEIDFEEGYQFIAKVNLDTDNIKIKRTDLVINYNPKILKVIDKSNNPGIQISEVNDLGVYQVNNVNEEIGEINISILGQAKSSINLELANILFETLNHGKADISINVNLSKIYNEADQAIGFRTTDLVISRIIEDRNDLKILHAQSTYLAEENTDITLDVSLFAENQEIRNFDIFYRTVKDGPNFLDNWKTLELEERNNNKYTVTIPAHDVELPGITYYFKIQTTKRSTTLPRPITLENAYQIRVVTKEEFENQDPPVVILDPPSGIFEKEIEVIAKSDKPNVRIFCSLDGTEPNFNSYIYVSPFLLRTTTTIKCFGIDSMNNIGEVVTGNYTKSEGLISANLEANPINIIQGQTSILNWNTSNADQAFIEPNLGYVELNGYREVRPLNTTTYTLIASKAGKSVEDKVTIYVSQKTMPTPIEPPNTGPEEISYILLLTISLATIYRINQNQKFK